MREFHVKGVRHVSFDRLLHGVQEDKYGPAERSVVLAPAAGVAGRKPHPFSKPKQCEGVPMVAVYTLTKSAGTFA
jgi:hypothetical protein